MFSPATLLLAVPPDVRMVALAWNAAATVVLLVSTVWIVRRYPQVRSYPWIRWVLALSILDNLLMYAKFSGRLVEPWQTAVSWGATGVSLVATILVVRIFLREAAKQRRGGAGPVSR